MKRYLLLVHQLNLKIENWIVNKIFKSSQKLIFKIYQELLKNKLLLNLIKFFHWKRIIKWVCKFHQLIAQMKQMTKLISWGINLIDKITNKSFIKKKKLMMLKFLKQLDQEVLVTEESLKFPEGSLIL